MTDFSTPPILKSKEVVIVGMDAGWDFAKSFNPDKINIWTIPGSFKLIGQMSNLVFELHEPGAKRLNVILYANTHTEDNAKLIVPRRVEGVTNNSYLLPKEELLSSYPNLPMVDSFAWMMVYALYRGCEKVSLCGINLNKFEECRAERDGIIFLIGYLRAKGVEVYIHEDKNIRGLKSRGIK